MSNFVICVLLFSTFWTFFDDTVIDVPTFRRVADGEDRNDEADNDTDDVDIGDTRRKRRPVFTQKQGRINPNQLLHDLFKYLRKT